MIAVFVDRAGVEVEQQKHDEQRDGQDDLQSLFHALHRLVLAAPFQLVASRNADFLRDYPFGIGDVAADIAAGDIHVNVAAETAIFIPDHARPGLDPDVGDLPHRYLGTRGSGDQHASQRLKIAAIVAQIPHVHRIPFTPFDGRRDRLSADGRHQYVVGGVDGQPVTRQFVALQSEIEKVAARGALGEDAGRTLHVLQSHLDLFADFLDFPEIGAKYLHARQECAPRS